VQGKGRGKGNDVCLVGARPMLIEQERGTSRAEPEGGGVGPWSKTVTGSGIWTRLNNRLQGKVSVKADLLGQGGWAAREKFPSQ